MRILLDECLPKKLKRSLRANLIQTVPEAGWAGKKNGELLGLAQEEFDVLVTNDQNIEHQQNLSRFDIAILVLVAPTNDIDDLIPLAPAANLALSKIESGQIRYIELE